MENKLPLSKKILKAFGINPISVITMSKDNRAKHIQMKMINMIATLIEQ